MLATVRRLSFHYTPLPTKYLYDPPPDRHRLTTYAKIKLEKIAPERILSKRWGSWVRTALRNAADRARSVPLPRPFPAVSREPVERTGWGLPAVSRKLVERPNGVTLRTVLVHEH